MFRHFVSFALILIALSSAANAQVKVIDKALVRTTGRFQYDIHYPQIGIPSVDKLLDRSGYTRSGGSVWYKVTRNDSTMLTIEIDAVRSDRLGPLPEYASLSFLAPDYAYVELVEFVDGQRGLKRISDLAIAQIVEIFKQRKTELTPELMSHIRRGASPEGILDATYKWLPNELDIWFVHFPIFGYGSNFYIRIPISAISDVVRANPRQPLPSFECSNVHTPIERSICSNVELARLDRDVARQYEAFDVVRLSEAFNELQEHVIAQETAERESHSPDRSLAQIYDRFQKQRSIQRDWLTERDALCASGDVSCLIASYKKRLKAGFL